MDAETYRYKHRHEQFMQNLNGTTAVEIVLVVLPAPLGIFLSTCICYVFSQFILIPNRMSKWLQFHIDFVTLIFPLIMCFTVCSNNHHVFTVIFSFMLILCTTYIFIYGIALPKECKNVLLQTSLSGSKRCFITNFRAVMNLLTAICILAVDFTIFPRRFAKTETFGYGLMDTGVGLFVISNAIVTPQALRHQVKVQNFNVLWKTIKGSIPLLLLGCARFFATHQIDYQVHVSEYGVHWNFFITLAVTKILSTLILQSVGSDFSVLLPVMLIGIHELVLQCGIQDWVMSDTGRQSFLTANREGIASSFGYVALYFAGIRLGQELHNYKFSFLTDLTLMRRLTIISFMMWLLTFICEIKFGVSRRLANIGYFSWIIAFSTTVLVILLFIELLTRLLNKVIKMRRDASNANSFIIGYVPLTLEAINYNGLAFFLIANLFTGLINICLQTLSLGMLNSVLIISGYSFLICSIVLFLYLKNIKLKVW